MKLIIGGRNCGQIEYARGVMGLSPACCSVEESYHASCIADFHDTLKSLLSEGVLSLDEYLGNLFQKNPNAMILCDEVGMGIIPLHREDRVWREMVGRACCAIALQADEVIRLVCGVPQVIKKTEKNING